MTNLVLLTVTFHSPLALFSIFTVFIDFPPTILILSEYNIKPSALFFISLSSYSSPKDIYTGPDELQCKKRDNYASSMNSLRRYLVSEQCKGLPQFRWSGLWITPSHDICQRDGAAAKASLKTSSRVTAPPLTGIYQWGMHWDPGCQTMHA